MSLFITFEGPDGSGKSTQVELLVAALRDRGAPVIASREPGGTPLGEAVRTLLLDPGSPPAGPLEMAFLLSASRAQLVEDVIRPALESGNVVIVDRYADSTLAYQAAGFGLDPAIARTLNEIATRGVQPNVTVYVEVPPEVSFDRLAARGRPNRLDSETIEFQRRVRDGYRQLIEQDPARWVTIDGNQPVEAVHEAIVKALEPVLSPPVGSL